MKNNLSNNQKKLICCEMFKFTFLGKYNLELLPYGNGYCLLIRGFKVLYDENLRELQVYGSSPKYKDKLYFNTFYDCVTTYIFIIKNICETFINEPFNECLDNLISDFDNYLPYLKEYF